MNFKEIKPVKEQIMKCVRCGKCRSLCPVFSEIRNETVAPRGHVFMVEMLRDEKVEPSQEVYERLANCLMCETCSANCPSGIDVHELNAAARSFIYEKNPNIAKDLIFDTLWTNPALLRSTKYIMWGAQKSGMQNLARRLGLTKILPGDLPQAEQILQDISFRSARSTLSEVNPAKGKKKFRVGYFLGCGTDLFSPSVARSLVRVLNLNQCEVVIPKTSKCCGLPQLANGKGETAKQLLAHNIKIYNAYDFDYIISDCASCTSALSRKNLEFLLGGLKIEDQAFMFADKIMDVNKFLIDIMDIQIEDNNTGDKIKVTYHDPCHLANAQNIKSEPREILKRIPNIEYFEMGEANRCCGGSGTYALTHYDLSMKILDKKIDSIMETGANYVATCCPSCTIQLKHGLSRHNYKAEVVHPLELLDMYYKNKLIKK